MNAAVDKGRAMSTTLVSEPEGNGEACSSGSCVDVDSVCRKWPP